MKSNLTNVTIARDEIELKFLQFKEKTTKNEQKLEGQLESAYDEIKTLRKEKERIKEKRLELKDDLKTRDQQLREKEDKIGTLEKSMKKNVKAMEIAKSEAITEFKTLKTTIGENKALSELKL